MSKKPGSFFSTTLLTFCLLIGILNHAIAQSESTNTYLQKALDSTLSEVDGAVVLVDFESGKVLAVRNPDVFFVEQHPPGSLTKVFTVIAYATDHGNSFPQYRCPRTLATDKEGCWDRNGHGDVNLEKAIADSCNVYFRRLSQQVSVETFAGVLEHFRILNSSRDLLHLPSETQKRLMVGGTHDLLVHPSQILFAYCALLNGGRLLQSDGKAQIVTLPRREILERIRAGMRAGAERGTSALAQDHSGVPLLGKTGTSLRMQNGVVDWKHTQGWWLGFYPPDKPEIAVMAFAPNGRGALDAAPLGGRALAEYLKLTHARK